MKKLFLLSLLLVGIFFQSCSQDESFSKKALSLLIKETNDVDKFDDCNLVIIDSIFQEKGITKVTVKVGDNKITREALSLFDLANYSRETEFKNCKLLKLQDTLYAYISNDKIVLSSENNAREKTILITETAFPTILGFFVIAILWTIALVLFFKPFIR